MLKAIITVGISASGKTSWAEEFVNNSDGTWANVNRDDIRFEEFCGGVRDWSTYKWKRSNENRVSDIYDQVLVGASQEGLNVVCSDTNLSDKYRARLANRLEQLGYEVEIKEFPISLEEAWKRDSLRANGVGHSVIARQWDQWLKYCRNNEEAAEYPDTYTPNKSKDKAVIVDIDGTLAHMTGRGPFDWDRVGEDDVDPLVKSVVEGLYLENFRVILMSGRDSVCWQTTVDWLDDNEIPHDKLFMRPQGDFRKDTVVKSEMFWQNVAENYNVVGAIDDRPCVCRMWSDMGIKVMNVGNPWIEF